MKRLIPLLLVVASAVTALPGSASAVDSWIFRPSYYSHHPVQPVTIGRQVASGRVAYSPTYGEFVRSGFRQTRSSIRTRGGSFDQVNVYESWIQVGAQY